MSISKRRADSNRRNSLSSTGPKTSEGKEIARYNSVTHGILSREVVITRGDGKEDPAEFEALLAGLRQDFDPLGALEDHLVEQVATCIWRHRRALRAESGAIRQRLDSLNRTFADQAREKGRTAIERVERSRADRASGPPVRIATSPHALESLKTSVVGLDWLIGELDTAVAVITDQGTISETDVRELAWLFGADPSELGRWLTTVCAALDDGRLDLAALQESESELTRNVVRMIDITKVELEQTRQHVTELEDLELEARSARFALPDMEVLEKIMRYEKSISNQMYRALNELERVQRLRGGESVPPPLTVSVNNE